MNTVTTRQSDGRPELKYPQTNQHKRATGVFTDRQQFKQRQWGGSNTQTNRKHTTPTLEERVLARALFQRAQRVSLGTSNILMLRSHRWELWGQHFSRHR